MNSLRRGRKAVACPCSGFANACRRCEDKGFCQWFLDPSANGFISSEGCLTKPHLPGSAEYKPPNDSSAAVEPVGPRDLLTAEQAGVLAEHLPIVRVITRCIHDRLPPHVPIEDLYSAGVLGLLDALGRFDPAKQVLFRTHAQFRIRGAILDSLRTLD
jgi:hypothetical protein